MSTQYTVQQAYLAGLDMIGMYTGRTGTIIQNFFTNIVLPDVDSFIANYKPAALVQSFPISEVESDNIHYQHAYQLPNDAIAVEAYTYPASLTSELQRGTLTQSAINIARVAITNNGILYTNLPVETIAYINSLSLNTPVSTYLYRLIMWRFVLLWAERNGFDMSYQTATINYDAAETQFKKMVSNKNDRLPVNYRYTESSMLLISFN